MKIVINGGHCPGLDSGAVGASGLQEAIVAKDIMKRTACFLRAVGYNVLEVQENELYQITDASNSFGADLFVSVHCNAATNTGAKGTETFYSSGSVKGGKLAQCIQNQIINSLGTVDRGLKTNNLYVTKYTDCPAVLVETAFISNAEDEALLINEGKRDQFAAAIARGITDYVGGL
ncbi:MULTISPECIES: N-acetylmuramoyl-L-alanine amidase family protein [Pelosinus]|uniref:Cell wall hydrolase/autolysin n=1 Tax=Pelosinus fermentans B4 TaxID=1149862 RepID=I8RKG6_9FIRM|nr:MULTISPECIES: N-acetylmuramoyl-L-alanine amidase [Pelosinus]EIW20703.1 cell wall hydrolase/autolysin [Pelosinus fermentans B4]EIW25452.1 cell wall hydrolase/autolysin [Pelosinus fermentans A11]OAM91971.1 cell wall hydrolase/autolysin [Pelosinus fermentans DSM 17108]OAM93712.1 cell wall hydrolase/autolysin [Pelosinus fermentans DSM 17108]SDQ03040.1 N-acetylmuramoyl-L-alanine amidase [Pelosinus fermentans]